MFSPNVSENTRLIDSAFIGGVSGENIQKYIITSETNLLVPECLVTFSNSEEGISSGILDFAFPTGVNIRYSAETPKFFSLTLTNEKGFRSYIYILILWEKIEFNDNTSLQNCINKIDIGTDLKHSNTPNKPNKPTINSTNYFFLPIAVCLSSSLFHTENFKEILHEFVKIVTYQNKLLSNHIDYSDNLEKYRYLEILNYFNLLGNAIIPPNFTNIRLNLRFSQVDFYLPSNYEIPTDGKNSCIQILFECLEISIIIKLWCSILTEKHIIIMANQNFLLFSICEALMRLIFPLKWLHTYIPLLPVSQIEYLEAPTPYIMGILSNSISFESLKETFPEHVICNVDTSEIHADNVVKLPQVEETKLRKKLQFVKNPEIFDIEEVITGQNKIMIEDVLPDRSFSDNVQHIFFRIFRNALGGFKTKYMLESVFYQVDFLNDQATHSEQHKLFWDKIIKTFAFEYFILSNQYLEVSNTKIFKNVIKLKEDDMQEKFSFNMTITLLDDNVEKLLKEINSICGNIPGHYDKEITSYNIFLKEHTAVTEPNEYCNNYYIKTEEFDESADNFAMIKRKATAKSHTVKWNNMNSIYQGINNTQENLNTINEPSDRKNSNRFDMTCYNLHKGNLLSCKFLTNLVKCEKDSDEFSFYKSQTSKKTGFIQFINNILNNIKLSNSGRTFMDLGMKTEIKKILEEKISKKSTFSANLHRIDEMNYEHDENEINLEQGSGTSSSNNINSMASTAIDKFLKSSGILRQDTLNSTKSKWVDLAKIYKKEILDLESSDCYQYHLAMAYLLEEFLLEDKKLTERENLFRLIIKHYEKAFTLSKKEFPSIRFYKLIDKLDTEFLTSLRIDFYEKYLERKEKRCLTDSHIRENGEKIHKANSHNIKGNGMIIEKTNRLIKIINVKYEKIKKKQMKIQRSIVEQQKSQAEKSIKNFDSNFDENFRNSPKTKKDNNITDSCGTCQSNFKGKKDNTMRATALTAISLKLKETMKSAINTKDSKNSNTFGKKSPTSDNSQYVKCDKDQEGFSSFLYSMKNAIREDIKKIQEKKKEISDSNKHSKAETTSNTKANQALTIPEKNLKIEIPQKKCEDFASNPNTGSNPAAISKTCYHSSNFIKNIQNYFFGNCEANRIIDTMKKNEGHIKTVVINSYTKYSKSVKDPLGLVLEISERLLSLFEDFSLNKFNSDVLNTKIINKVTSSDNFKLLKENVAELQKINITKFSSNTEKISFWLNLFNFLTIFTILHNVEILSTHYEWVRFLKNSLFNIGGYDLTLFEIQYCILSDSCNFYGNCEDWPGFNQNDIRTKLVVEDKSVFISFAVTIPTMLRYYPPDNLEENLTRNFSEYCQANISVDQEKGVVSLSEFITWIDMKFKDNVENYKGYVIKFLRFRLLEKNVYEMLKDGDSKLVKIKFSWKTDFTNVVTKFNV